MTYRHFKDYCRTVLDPEFSVNESDLICKILKNRKGQAGSTWKLELIAHAMQIGANAVPYERKEANKTKLSV